MKKVKPNLKKMLDEIEWIAIPKLRSSYNRRLNSDEVIISFTPSKKNDDVINKICVKIGENIINQLKWKKGDQIVVLQDKHNPMNFLLVKTESGNGFTLSSVYKSSGYRVQFKWNHSKELKRYHGIVDHYIKNNQIIMLN